MLNTLITSKTRLRMLIKFFINTTNKGYLNGLATEFNKSTNSIRKELNNLSAAGYLLKSKSNNRVIYNANKKHPLFKVLQKVIKQHLGIDEIVTTILEKLGDVKSVAIPILSHRVVKNYKAEAENISVSDIIKTLL